MALSNEYSLGVLMSIWLNLEAFPVHSVMNLMANKLLDGGFKFVKVYASVLHISCFFFFRLMVVALQEKIAAFDACTFKSCFCITSEFYVKHEICVCMVGGSKLFLHRS